MLTNWTRNEYTRFLQRYLLLKMSSLPTHWISIKMALNTAKYLGNVRVLLQNWNMWFRRKQNKCLFSRKAYFRRYPDDCRRRSFSGTPQYHFTDFMTTIFFPLFYFHSQNIPSRVRRKQRPRWHWPDNRVCLEQWSKVF